MAHVKQYDLKLKNLFSMTSDNGPNVVKCIKILQVFQSGSVDDYLDYILEHVVDTQLGRTSDSNFPIGIRCIAHVTNSCLDDAMERK